MDEVDVGFEEAIAGFTPQEMLALAQRLEKRARELRRRAASQPRQKPTILFRLEKLTAVQPCEEAAQLA